MRTRIIRLICRIKYSSAWVWARICCVSAGARTHYFKYRPLVKDRIRYYRLLMRIDRPIGFWLLLWPVLWALWIAAEGSPDPYILLVFICGTFLMRSAGVVLNDVVDRDFDGRVERTCNRPIVTGHVTPREALCLAAGLIIIAFFLVLTLNSLTIRLSFIALALAALYPFMKRYTYLPQFFLGAAFGWSIPMAFAAQTNTLPQVCWVLFITNILWSVVYDTTYAIIDREDDLRAGIKSTAILFADADRIIIAIIQLLVLIGFMLVAAQLKFGIWFYAALFGSVFINCYQLYLIWDRGPTHCMRAFLSHHNYGALLFFGIFLDYLAK